MRTQTFLIILTLIIFMFGCHQVQEIDLSGTWKYQLDENEKGEAEKWYAKKGEGNTLILPAALRDHHIGNNPTLKTQWTGGIYDSSWFYNPEMAKYRKTDSLKFPFWLTPVKRYVGKAWYQKEINIPKSWLDKELEIFLERPHWQTKVWFDTLFLGFQNSLSTPHVFIVPAGKLKPGAHYITICVDNAIHDIDPGINSHSISDHTQGNWNGLVGKLSLTPVNKTKISLMKLNPDIQNKSVKAAFHFKHLDLSDNAEIYLEATELKSGKKLPLSIVVLDNSKNTIETSYPMGDDFLTWSEFSPDLYELKVILKDASGQLDEKTSVFGMREFTIDEKHFNINGTRTFLRGTTECSVFPLTGYPPTDTASWGRIYRICQSYGLNHMRFHSYCPPEAAFVAADKAGVYLQVEGPSWAKYSTTLGDGKPLDKYLMDETRRIIDTYGNHPSFVMMAYGNEPSGNYVGYLENWVDHFRKFDPQRVFTGASTGRSWAIIENSDFIVRSPPRGLAWKNQQPENTFDYRNKTENQERPYVTFEMGQWCVFPNFEEITKYTGPLKARNFELFQEDLKGKGMGDQANDFLMASGKLQALCYKQEIEATLRTPNLAGFQLLSLNDFSGQGTALVGVLDAFWDEKGYITAIEFRQFCNQVVPLVRLPQFTFSNSDTLKANLEVANFSGREITSQDLHWQISYEDGSTAKTGVLSNLHIPLGNGKELGSIELPLSFVTKAEKLKLQVSAGKYTNQWNVWVYPENEKVEETHDIYICNSLDKKAEIILEQGGKVLLLASGKVENGKDVVQYFTPVFWNTSWFRMRPPHTTGVLIQENHPVFDGFPTDYYSDLQWWELLNRQQAMNLENFPSGFKPIVQAIDTWFLNRKLAMMFEGKVGEGKVLMCSFSLENLHKDQMVSRQLYNAILKYMVSENFDPKETLETGMIKELFEKKDRPVWNSYVRENP